MFEMLNNLSVIILEVICSRIFFGAFFLDKDNITRKQSFIIFVIQSFAVLLICILLKNHLWLREFFIILSLVAIMYLLKEGPFWKILLLSVTFIGVVILFDLVILFIIHLLSEQLDFNDIGSTLSGRLGVVIEKTGLMLMVLYVRIRADKKRGSGLADTEWIRFVFFPIFTIISTCSMIVVFNDINDMNQANVLYAIAFGMVIMILFIYCLINDIVEREVALKEREIEYSQFRNQIELYNNMRTSLERQKERAHEFKNHIVCVDSLAKEKRYEELEQYISSIQESSYMIRDIIDTNNVIVNTILNEKYNEMMNKGIVFVFRVNDLSSLPIGDEDLVVLLSNLLNNGIEACEKCEGKKIIKIKFMIENDLAILSVKNTSPSKWIPNNEVYATTKCIRKDEHGIGIRNITNVIEKYNGTYSIKSMENEFYFAIAFPMNKE